MEARTTMKNSQSSSIDFNHQFNNTIEGTLISYLKSHSQVTLNELIEHTVSNKNLRTKYAKKYRYRNIEKLVLSKLVTKQHIFIENRDKTWTLNEKTATEYECQKIAEIKEINEKKQEARLGKCKKKENKPREKREKLKIFDKVINSNIFAKLEQLEEIMESPNESAHNEILAFFKPSSNNSISKR